MPNYRHKTKASLQTIRNCYSDDQIILDGEKKKIDDQSQLRRAEQLVLHQSPCKCR